MKKCRSLSLQRSCPIVISFSWLKMPPPADFFYVSSYLYQIMKYGILLRFGSNARLGYCQLATYADDQHRQKQCIKFPTFFFLWFWFWKNDHPPHSLHTGYYYKDLHILLLLTEDAKAGQACQAQLRFLSCVWTTAGQLAYASLGLKSCMQI